MQYFENNLATLPCCRASQSAFCTQWQCNYTVFQCIYSTKGIVSAMRVPLAVTVSDVAVMTIDRHHHFI